jgi:hypothetical protein
MAMLFSGGEFAEGVTRFSASVLAVTVANAIAACRVATRHAGSKGDPLIDAISRARKDAKTIATGSVSTGDATGFGIA